MKKFLLIAAGLAFLAGVTSGQEYKSRLPTPTEQSRIAGVTSYVQDELLRSKTPKFFDLHILTNGLLTAYNDGVVIARPVSNGVAVVGVLGRITLPNPTNNINRRFEIISGPTMLSVTLTNNTGLASGFGIVDLAIGTNSHFFTIATNKVGFVYSTGTNWVAYSR